jgi:hypothetical protein
MYEIQTRFINDWENVWHCDGQLQYFDNYDEAYRSLNDFLDDMEEAYLDRSIEDQYDIEDFRIVELVLG